jgi:hypothetical protein
VDDVAEGGSAGAGDDADAVGEGREWAFAGLIEEAFGGETALELLEGELECAFSARAHGLCDELEGATGLVDGDAAAEFHVHAVFGLKGQERGTAAEHDDGELGVAVFEGEVQVTGGGGTAVRDFAFDREEAGVGGFESLAELVEELADGIEDWLGRES